ncbi:MAG TPA: hypothetical protein VIB98_08330, partial [Gemmatimonadaceae bacterium]
MGHFFLSTRSVLACGTLACLAQLGCSDSNPLTPQDKDLAALRQAVSGMRDLSAAQAAGYTVAVGDPGDGHTCLSDAT